MLALSTEQMRSIEKEAIELYGIPEIIMMENASRAVAEHAATMVKRKKLSGISVVCGSGNNGGDGLAAARHLHNKGISVKIFLAKNKDSFRGLSSAQLAIVEKMGLPIVEIDRVPSEAKDHVLLIDALLGTGLKGEVTGSYRNIIESIDFSQCPVLSVDIPSGLDADRGMPLGTAVKARTTVTMAAPKIGMIKPHAQQYTGKIIIADIGIPKELIEKYIKSVIT